ncbi:MAG: DNA repair protein RecO C-terminal domain-containing protein, partial [Burkholderiaceae bacterium]
AYLHTLGALSEDRPAAPALRSFEAVLLREAGYGVRAAHAADGTAIDPLALYRYVPERGPMRITPVEGARGDSDTVIVGKTLLDIDADDFSDATTLAQSKRLMRHLLQHHLAGQVLHTRRMVLDLQSLEEEVAR